METAARVALSGVLLVAVAGKVRVGRELPDLLTAYGVPRPVRAPAAVVLVVLELVVAILLLIDATAEAASYIALLLGLVFVVATASARLRGRERIRCGCFGAQERSTTAVLARALGFTALAAVAVFAGRIDASPSRDTLVLISLAVLAGAVLVLALLVLALYRQVGVLTLRLGPRAPLELAEEGPPLGLPAPALTGLLRRGPELVAFFAEDCRLCRELAPAVRALGRDGLHVEVAYEGAQSDAFRRWNIPGAPFVVHVVDGVVAAKGLVNSLEQLDDLVALGVARMEHAAA